MKNLNLKKQLSLLALVVASSTAHAQSSGFIARVERFDERSLTVSILVCSDEARGADIRVRAYNRRDRIAETTVSQRRGCQNARSVTLALPRERFDLMQEADIRIEATDPITGNRVELEGSGIRGYFGDVQTINRGLFSVRRDQAIYESNGRDQYCQLADQSQAIVRLGVNGNMNNIRSYPTKPMRMNFSGTCETLMIPAGVFWSQKSAYYSNGQNAYCGFSTPDHLELTAGRNPKALRFDQGIQSAGAKMQNHGTCVIEKVPNGFFKLPDNATIYFSNGSDAFCGIRDMEQFKQLNPNNRPVWNLTTLPSKMRHDPLCSL